MPADHELTPGQRAAAIDRASESLALRSGAGCGKTFVLARRFVELLMRSEQPDAAMGRLVALTFTEKAALEMSARVRGMLAEAAAGAGGEDRRRLLGWLDELGEARISTIHGFCASVLRTCAIEAGIDPAFAVCADELLAERMLADAADQAVLQAVEQEAGDVADLLVSLSYDRLVSLVQTLIEKRTALDLSAWTDAGAVFDRWRGVLEAQRAGLLAGLGSDAALRRELDELADLPCAGGGDKLAAFRDEHLATVRAILADPAAATAELFASLPASAGGIGSPKSWGGREALRAVRARLKALLAAVRSYAIYAERPGEPDRRAAAATATLAGLAARAEALYAAEKRRRGLLDFDDLLAHTARLLADQPGVRRSLAATVDQLLIDECQDTDGCQLDLLGRLVSADPGGEPRAGKLFVVGDAKQSIYRFRGAQVEVFRETCERLGPSRQETLATSFRTHGAGVAFVNELFAALMGEAYEPVRAHREACPAGPSVEVLLAAGADGEPIADAAAATEAQAAVTAERIAEILHGDERIVWDAGEACWRPARAADVAVLFARMTCSLAYERALQDRGVPYYVVAGTGFFQQQEVFDVLNALQAVDNPYDDIALFGALRSSLFGLDDNTLMHVAEACSTPYFAALGGADLSGRLDADQGEALAFAVDLIGRLHRVKDAVRMDVLLERLLTATGYEATLLSRFGGGRRVRNVRLAAERARSASAERLGLADFVEEMRRLVIEESRYEQAAMAGEAEDVVRLMTIHKAKGLEFPVVVIPDLNAGRLGYTGRLLVRRDWGLTFNYTDAETDETEQAPLAYRLAKRLEDAESRREDIRRLYVAATRHQDHLVFVGADFRGRDGAFRSHDSYLAMMDGVLDFSKALAAGADRLPYGEGGFAASVRRVAASTPRPAGRPSRGRKLLSAATSGADLAAAIEAAGAGGSVPRLVGPLPAEVGAVELAVTALGDFATCPMLYRWRHELRLPRGFEEAARGTEEPRSAREPQRRDTPQDAQGLRSLGFGEKPEAPQEPQGPQSPGVGLDAATLGTFYHRCMELLDFVRPQAPGALVRRVAGEMELADSADLGAIEAELGGMLARFAGHPLAGKLAAAKACFPELDFVMDCGAAVLRGQIDLLWQDDGGGWHVVDYKSDRVGAADVAAHAERYELQLLVYAAAAARHLGEPVREAVLYFLVPAATHAFAAVGAGPAGVEARAGELARSLLTCRRAGRFPRRTDAACGACPYASLCEGLEDA